MIALPLMVRDWCHGLDSTLAAELLTCRADGWPHLAHLSCGEVVIDTMGQLRLALWAGSRGTHNLVATGQACLILASPEGVFEIRLALVGTLALPSQASGPDLQGFCLEPIAVCDKSAPYASITSALRFALHDPQTGQARWAQLRQQLFEVQVEALNRDGPGQSPLLRG
ncbi:hypothetical protein [Novosphingobium sp.]|uniref:hypothetical protein n=1 Tax=Novosphingobium sp. TaxID=1874826 RepID=UPI0031D145BB